MNEKLNFKNGSINLKNGNNIHYINNANSKYPLNNNISNDQKHILLFNPDYIINQVYPANPEILQPDQNPKSSNIIFLKTNKLIK